MLQHSDIRSSCCEVRNIIVGHDHTILALYATYIYMVSGLFVPLTICTTDRSYHASISLVRGVMVRPL